MKHYFGLALLITIVLFAFIPSTTAFSYNAQLNCELILQQDESPDIQAEVITENVIAERLSYQTRYDLTEQKFEQAYIRSEAIDRYCYSQKNKAEQFIKMKAYNDRTIVTAVSWPQTFARRL